MATRKNTSTQPADFFASSEFTTYEKPRWAYQAKDPVDKGRDDLLAGIEKQLEFLSGKQDIKGRKWYQSTDHNGIFVQFRLVNRVVKLKGDADSVKASSTAEAGPDL